MSRPMNNTDRIEVFRRFKMENPTPVTELRYNSPFELLIAVVLSAQATDISVNKATKPLFSIANTPRAIADLGEEGLRPYIKSIGLYKTKAANIIKTCHRLCEEYQGQIPSTREGLESLPGVGRKSANVILNTIFGEPTMAVDTHIFRVANRTGIGPGKNVREVEAKLLKVIPEIYIKEAHHWLVLHGRYICVARKPKCSSCLIHDLCRYTDKTES
jgi:endonuclease III